MKLTNIFAVALAGLALTACSNDDVPNPGTSAEEATTYIGLTIQLPKSSVTKAEDTEATQDETKLTNLKVYCWKEGANGMGTPTEVNIDNGTTSAGSNAYKVTAAIKANVGKNNLFVVANTSDGLTLSDVSTPNAIEKTLATLTDASSFIMYSDKITVLDDVEQADKTEVEAGRVAANNATVKLRRAVAKVSVTSALEDYTDGISDLDGNGKIYDIKFSIVNQPTKLYPVIKMINTDGDFIASNVISPYDAFDASSTPIALPTAEVTPASLYCKENVHGADVYKENNTTAVCVEASFVLSAEKYISNVEEGQDGNYKISYGTADMNKEEDFYVLIESDGNLNAGNFFNQTAATAYASIKHKNAEELLIKYNGGKCYWPIWINDGNTASPSYGVLRNHIYKMNIKSIAAPGYPSFPNSDKPIAADTWIQLTVDVEAWATQNMGEQELK